jgi:hypothetical protein
MKVSNEQPNLKEGDQWYDTDNFKLYEFVSGNWVEIECDLLEILKNIK